MSKLRLSVSYSDSYELVTFVALDEQDQIVAKREYLVNDLPSDNSAHTHAYGLNKLLTDRTSDIKDKMAKLDAMDTVFEFLCSGEWAKERVVGAPVVSCEVEALAQIMELKIPEAQAALAAYPKDTRKTILAHENVVKIADVIRKRRNAPDHVLASLDDMLGLSEQ